MCAPHGFSCISMARRCPSLPIAQWPMPVLRGAWCRIAAHSPVTNQQLRLACAGTHTRHEALRRGPRKASPQHDRWPSCVVVEMWISPVSERPSIDRLCCTCHVQPPRPHLSHGALARHALDGFARAPRLRPSLPLITLWTVTSCRSSPCSCPCSMPITRMPCRVSRGCAPPSREPVTNATRSVRHEKCARTRIAMTHATPRVCMPPTAHPPAMLPVLCPYICLSTQRGDASPCAAVTSLSTSPKLRGWHHEHSADVGGAGRGRRQRPRRLVGPDALPTASRRCSQASLRLVSSPGPLCATTHAPLPEVFRARIRTARQLCLSSPAPCTAYAPAPYR